LQDAHVPFVVPLVSIKMAYPTNEQPTQSHRRIMQHGEPAPPVVTSNTMFWIEQAGGLKFWYRQSEPFHVNV